MSAARAAARGRAAARHRAVARLPSPHARRYVVRLATAVLLSVAGPAGYGAGSPAEAPPGPHAEVAILLGHVQWAAEHRNYVGRFVHQEGAQIQTSRIVHLAEASGEVEKLEMLDGRSREYVRHGDDVQGFIPDRKLIVAEKRVRREKFPALLSAPGLDIDEHYRLERAPPERVAGHLCDVAILYARDDLRYGYKLWIDRGSSLLLKLQTIGDQDAVLQQVAFTDITIGGHIDRNLVRPSVTSTEGWRTEQHVTQPASFDNDAWTLTDEPPGFHTILEIKRTFASGREVGQMVLSDGLAAVSVFIETADSSLHTAGEVSKGAINVVSKAVGRYWLTVVGEAPQQTIRDIAATVVMRSTPK